MVFLLNLLTFGLWGKLGRLVHYAVDAALVSTVLAGMRRSTGLTPSFQTTAIAGENTETSKWIGIYLGFGETVMDTAIAVAGQSGYFKRQR